MDIETAKKIMSRRGEFQELHTAATLIYPGRFRDTLISECGESAVEALETWHRRQIRESHPDGHFDNARRFYPSTDERRSCCDGIREPSRAWPNSFNVHCRSLEHAAELHDVEPEDVRRAAFAAIRLMVTGSRPQ